MLKRYIHLETDEQLECCWSNQIEVDVWLQGLTSLIQFYDEVEVRFAEGRYRRSMLRYSDQLRDKTGGIESFESWDLDRLRTLKPELIVASNYMHAELRGQLEEIAPVLIKSEEVRPLDNLKVFGSCFAGSARPMRR